MKTHYSDYVPPESPYLHRGIPESPYPHGSSGSAQRCRNPTPIHRRLLAMDQSKTPVPVSTPAADNGFAATVADGADLPSSNIRHGSPIAQLIFNDLSRADDPMSRFVKKLVHAITSVPEDVDGLLSEHTAYDGNEYKAYEELDKPIGEALDALKGENFDEKAAIFCLEDSYFGLRPVSCDDDETVDCYKEGDLKHSHSILKASKNIADEGLKYVQLGQGVHAATRANLEKRKQEVHSMISEWLHGFVSPLEKTLSTAENGYEAKSAVFTTRRNYMENALIEREKLSRFMESAGCLSGPEGTKEKIHLEMEAWVGIRFVADVEALAVTLVKKKFNLLFFLGLPRSFYIYAEYGLKQAKCTIGIRREEKIRFCLFTGLPLDQIVATYGYGRTKDVWMQTSNKEFPLAAADVEKEQERTCALDSIKFLTNGGIAADLNEADRETIKTMVIKRIPEAKFEWATDAFWSGKDA